MCLGQLPYDSWLLATQTSCFAGAELEQKLPEPPPLLCSPCALVWDGASCCLGRELQDCAKGMATQ